MDWQPREGDSRDGSAPALGGMAGDWQGIRPSLDNPLSWSLSLGRIAGIELRLHVTLLAYILVSLMQSLGTPDTSHDLSPGFEPTVMSLGALLMVVLLHELGHCLACRAVGGEADEILMWPLGGLAHCRPPNQWRAHLVTALGGLGANVLICAVLAPVLWARTGQWWAVAIPNPVDFLAGWPKIKYSRLLQVLYFANTMNFVVLWFNLLPVFPLDGGRIVQACLWPRLGYARSMRIVVRIGYGGAILLGILGAAQQQWSLVAVAAFGAITCYGTHRQLEFTQRALGLEEADYAMAPHSSREANGEAATGGQVDRRAEREAARMSEEAVELDRVLQKIAESGMGSLTGQERRLLKRATDRKRRADDRTRP